VTGGVITISSLCTV